MFTLLVPYVEPTLATEWHPAESTGPFSVLNRGLFDTEALAHEWAKRLNGTPYSVVPCEVPRTTIFQVYGLDVWGHGPGEHAEYNCDGCDGYQVNGRSRLRTIEIEHVGDDPTGAEIVAALVAEDLLVDNAADLVDVDVSDGFGTIDHKEDGCPLLQVERVES